MLNKVTVLFVLLSAIPALGANVVLNGSFESPAVAPGACFTFNNPPFPLCSVPNWTGGFAVDGDAGGGSVSGPPPSPIPDGSQWAMVFNSDSISQTVNISQAGTYTLTWFDAGRGDNPFNVSGNQSYSVIFGGNVFGFFTTTQASPWGSHSIPISTGVGSFTLSFSFSGSGGAAAYIDNVQLNGGEPVGAPEPGTLALATASLSLIALRGLTSRWKAARHP